MYIKHPKTNRKIFLDNRYSDYQIRYAEVVTKVLTDDIINYCLQNSLIKNKLQIFSYENARQLLENCATYLLKGQFKKGNIMTLYNIRRAVVMEIPASCTSSNAEDLMYGLSEGDKEIIVTASPQLTNGGFEVDIQNLSQVNIERSEKREKKKITKYKQSKSFRLEKLYTTREINTYRIKQVFYKDAEGKRKPMKNVMNQPVFDAVPHKIGQKGMIDYSKPYTSKWCVVDTDNEFVFMDKRYQIDGNVEQYSVGEDNQCQMDKILCYYIPHEDKFLFFDQDIYQIDNSDILQVQ